MSEIRYDRLHDTHVIISPERLHRPDCNAGSFKRKEDRRKVCPFCEGNEKMTPPEIFALREKDSYKNKKGWQTRVVPNLYKALQIETPHQHHYGFFEHLEGFGAHEVIIDTPQHYTSMVEWSETNVVNWLKTLRSRVIDLRGDHRLAYISLFKNEGSLAGCTQAHSHTQLIALPIIPKQQRDSFLRVHEHYKHHEKSIYETILEHEENENVRVVQKHGDFTVFCPYASAYPFEVMISSKKALGQINSLSNESIEEVSTLLLSTLKKLKMQLGCFDFNLNISTPPLQESTLGDELFSCVDAANRFYIRIIPRIYKHGGFEKSTGVIINPVAPERAAKLLKESRYE